jgi:hypothetical protein
MNGGMGERFNPAVLKTVELERVPGVRIPLPPPTSLCDSDSRFCVWLLLYLGNRRSGEPSPMTYEMDGRQYLLTAIQNVIFAWALPKKIRRWIGR